MKEKKVKKEKKKMSVLEKLFVILSWIVVVCCCVFYGSRLLKYYKLYNPDIDENEKQLVLAYTQITRNTPVVYEGDGLYRISGKYVYKGESVNNYVKFSNLTWRILSIESDGSFTLVNDTDLNELYWDSSITNYEKSDIYQYINDKVYSNLNQDYLGSLLVCTDKINDANAISCDLNMTSNISLLSLNDYLNTKVDKSYISGSQIWLSDRSDDSAWLIDDENIALSEPNNFFSVRTVINIKSQVTLVSGDGSKENPYVFEEKSNMGIGNYILLGEDKWVIYDKDDNGYYIVKDEIIDTLEYDGFDLGQEESTGYYLNTTYLDSLPYKSLLQLTTWYTGSYTNSYENIKSESVTATIGLPTIADLKFSSATDYYLLTPSTDEKQYVYKGYEIDSETTMFHGILPTAYTSLDLKVESGDGSYDNPYVIGGY